MTGGRDIVIFDLDGTLADISHRQHMVQSKRRDWPGFFAACVDDAPHEAVITILRALQSQFEIWLVSGRSDEVREQTENWLRLNGVPWHELIMRHKGDYTPDNLLKIGWVQQGRIPKDRILCVFDDRDKVVKAWRKAGIPCFQVAEGDF